MRTELTSGPASMSITTNGTFRCRTETNSISSTWPRMKPSTRAFLIAQSFSVFGARHNKNARGGLIADFGDAKQEVVEKWALDGVGLRHIAWWQNGDGVRFPAHEEAPFRVRAGIAEFTGRRLDQLADLGPDQIRPVEGVGRGAEGNAGGFGNVGKPHRSARHDFFEALHFCSCVTFAFGISEL